MISLIICLFLSASATAVAQKAKTPAAPKSSVAQKPTVTVWTRGHASSARRMFQPGLPVRVLGSVESRERDRLSGHLRPGERNALFRKVGIEAKVTAMDEMEKDLLVMLAREYTVRELKTEFPKLSENHLKRLKEELGKIK